MKTHNKMLNMLPKNNIDNNKKKTRGTTKVYSVYPSNKLFARVS